MPGSTENTEGNASAVPSVASGNAQPLTRREARALREAQAKEKVSFGADATASSKAPAEASTMEKQPELSVPPLPVSESEDLAETGQPDVQEAAIPPELLIGNPEPKVSRAGRNLPAAIGVGVVLLGIVLVGLFWVEPLLVIAVTILSGIGCWEVARATTHAKTAVPQIPLYLASILLPVSAVLGGIEALGFSFVACIFIALLFRLMEGLKGAVASVMSSVFIISWIPLLLSFAMLMLDGNNGRWLIATILLLAVANDTFGYIVGVLIGKHPMAPKISPKKSWEGFAGSLVGSAAIGAAAMYYWLDMPWWTGVILAFFTTIAATTGDFAESMVKRELGIKDMSNLLPGHGGIMDRLDSVLFVIPLGYLISHMLAAAVL